jgi:small GTP-binding protein
MRVVATAGHVDHGKSTLVLALTGTDPDRFAEEKARGLTIDLGFAFTTLPSGTDVGFVDVPGHVRFVKNMLAGVGAVEIALLVVAANEGWMPQTAEHVAILELLDIRSGLVAVTKADLVDAETLELAQLELADHLAATRLAHWPVVAVDSVSGRGLDELRAVLDAVLAGAPDALDTGRPRVWIDRVFSARGSGTVVTGTLTGGGFSVDQEVVVEPGTRAARIRRIESQGAHLERVGPGSRVALNLAGVEHDAVRRGHAVVLPGQWATPTTVDVPCGLRLITSSPGGPVDAHADRANTRPRFASSMAHRRARRLRTTAVVGRPSARPWGSRRVALLGPPRDDRWRGGARRVTDSPHRGRTPPVDAPAPRTRPRRPAVGGRGRARPARRRRRRRRVGAGVVRGGARGERRWLDRAPGRAGSGARTGDGRSGGRDRSRRWISPSCIAVRHRRTQAPGRFATRRSSSSTAMWRSAGSVLVVDDSARR